MSVSEIRRAVIPAAGFGTRFLPFTKSVPKELIPVVDKPVIQYVVEEAAASGIEDILIVLSAGKEAVRHHFSPAAELEERLEKAGQEKLRDELRTIGGTVRISYVCQKELNGLGGAILLAREFTAGEFFAVLLGDTILRSSTPQPVTAQLIELYRRHHAAVVAVEEVPEKLVPRYGIVGGKNLDADTIEVEQMVEKPAAKEAPGRLAVASRYILSPGIFAALEQTPLGKNNELQLTDAMRSMLGRERLIARRISGSRHDIGDKLSFLKNTVDFGLRRPEFREEFMQYLKSLLAQEENRKEE